MSTPKFTKGEQLCLTYTAEGSREPTHYITTSPMRDMYFLYKTVSGKAVKTKHKASNPIELYKYMEE